MSDTLFWERLQGELEAWVADFPGVAGLSLLDITAGRRIEVNGQEQFPTASTIKIHLLTALVELHERGELSQDERVVIDRRVPGSGVLTYLDDKVELSWRDVANLMIITSDNTATNMVIDRLGYERMAGFFKDWGLSRTQLVRKMQEHDAVARNHENLSTPSDECAMMEILLENRGLRPGVGEECLRILKKPKRGFFAPALPPDLPLANKPGAMDRVRADTAVIFLPRRPYALSVMTKFGDLSPVDQERWIIDLTGVIHSTMKMLDTTSAWGQGMPAAYLPKGGS